MKPTANQILKRTMALAGEDDNMGICFECGNEQGGCEPDARKYECENCGQMAVFGAEEIIIMNGEYDGDE
jgi:hypothetical protein